MWMLILLIGILDIHIGTFAIRFTEFIGNSIFGLFGKRTANGEIYRRIYRRINGKRIVYRLIYSAQSIPKNFFYIDPSLAGYLEGAYRLNYFNGGP